VMVHKSTLSYASIGASTQPDLLCHRALSIECHRYHAPIAAVVLRSTPRDNNVFVGGSESTFIQY